MRLARCQAVPAGVLQHEKIPLDARRDAPEQPAVHPDPVVDVDRKVVHPQLPQREFLEGRGGLPPALPGAGLLPEHFRLRHDRQAQLRQPESPRHVGSAEGHPLAVPHEIPERFGAGKREGIPGQELLHAVHLRGGERRDGEAGPPLPPFLRLGHQREEKPLGRGGDGAAADVLVSLHVHPSPEGSRPPERGNLEGVEAKEGEPVESPGQLLRRHEQFAGGGKTFLLPREEEVLLRLREGIFRRGKAGGRVFGDDHDPCGEVVEHGGRAAVKPGEHRIDPVVPYPLPEKIGAGPGGCRSRRLQELPPGDHLGAGNDGQILSAFARPLRRRVEPADRLDPVSVQRNPRRPGVGGAVHVHDSPADGIVPRVGRCGQPRIAQLGEPPGKIVPVDLLPDGDPEDRRGEHLRRKRLLERGRNRAHDHGGHAGRCAPAGKGQPE
ncbi:MAG: hypothetical protein XU12_C0005G0050 [Deltaproteobacteria bacterium CSP1-8]|nr:MAG: hypothetical protein XU12_C0005G0050 [Deltaproteobacteria bacterium CSP1-8]